MKDNFQYNPMDSIIPENITAKIQDLVEKAEKILFLGIGEVNMGDDGFGPYITAYFSKKSSNNFLFINGATTPEFRKEEILVFKPDLMFLIDTCDSGDPPGTLILADEKKLVNYLPISSHTLPIQLFITSFKSDLPGLQTYLLGVNPVSLLATEERFIYKPEKFDLDDFERDPNLPFFEINLTPEIYGIADKIIKFLEELLKTK
jgi:hydrogenase maturation protease